MSGHSSPAEVFVAALSSAAAALVVHSLWPGGTILGAALMPVLVALFAELLRRPAERFREVAWAHLGDGALEAAGVTPPADRVYGMGPRWSRALAIGLAGFLIGAAVLTAAELVIDRSLTDRGAGTTLLGGARQSKSPVEPTSDPRPAQRGSRSNGSTAPRPTSGEQPTPGEQATPGEQRNAGRADNAGGASGKRHAHARKRADRLGHGGTRAAPG